MAALCVVGMGCRHRSPQAVAPGPDPAPPVEAVDPPGSPQGPADAGPVDAVEDPSSIARTMADRWCEAGGRQFAPPGPGSEDDYPPRLESCADIEVEVADTATLGDTVTSVLVLDAFFETRELLLYQSGGVDLLASLSHEYEDESGEAGVYYRSYESIELRDVYGDEAPEWIATVVTTGGDSFEADRCYAHDERIETLILCTPAQSKLRCFAYDVVSVDTASPRTPDELYDCEEPPSQDEPPTQFGHASTVTIERDVLILAPAGGEGAVGPIDPPRTGRVELSEMFSAFALEFDDE